MASQRLSARPATRVPAEQSALRATVLRLGRQLGWPPSVVTGFCEAVTGLPWARCGPTEWWAVLEEYRDIVAAIAAKHARRQARALAAAWRGAEEDEHGSKH